MHHHLRCGVNVLPGTVHKNVPSNHVTDTVSVMATVASVREYITGACSPARSFTESAAPLNGRKSCLRIML
jgi:hypothetical protein